LPSKLKGIDGSLWLGRMSFSLSKVFSKKGSEELWAVQDSESIPTAVSREAFYRYLFKKEAKAEQLSLPKKLVIDLVVQKLQKKETREKTVPRLPHVIPRLIQSLKDPDSSVKDYVDIIDKDPVMAAAVLKLANSAYFNPIGRRINEIDQATVKLGIDGLRSVLSAAVMQPIIQKESAYFSKSGKRIWLHSLFTAIACEMIADHRRIEKFKVYVLGLIHDVGKITLFSELCKQYKLNDGDSDPGYNAFVPPLKKLSTALSYSIAKDWNMPNDIIIALEDQLKVRQGAEVSPFGHVLHQANHAAEVYAAVYPVNPVKAKRVLSELDLPEDLFEAFDQVVREL